MAVGERFLTYAELDKLSNQVARALLAQGVAPGDRVGILAPKSAASVVGLFGVLKAGACYVPLDPKQPAARLAAIMADSGIAVVLADQATARQAAAMAGSVPPLRTVIVTGPHWGREATAGPEPGTTSQGPAVVPWDAVLAEPAGAPDADQAIETDLAYILYTSGSTGTPKGVMISHRASLTFVDWAAACAGLGEQDRVCSPAPLNFDLSVFDVFATCKAAACMAVVPEKTSIFPARLAQWIEREQISVWYSVPSVLTMLATLRQPAGIRPVPAAGGHLRRGGVPGKAPELADGRTARPALPQLVRAHRDQRLHLVRGPARRRAHRPGSDREGLRQHGRVRGHQRGPPGSQARGRRRTVRPRARADARLLGPAGKNPPGAHQQPLPGGLRRARLPHRATWSPWTTRATTSTSAAATAW